MIFNNKIAKQIKLHAESSFPYECCGLIVSINNDIKVVNCINESENKKDNFIISPLSYLKAEQIGKIIAYYHSHTQQYHNTSFTELDKLNSFYHKLPMILYNLVIDKFFFNFENTKFSQYIGIPFQYNTNDCLSLVEQFYLQEFNIKLPHIIRDSNTLSQNPNLVDEQVGNFNFNSVDTPQFGDIIVIKRNKIPSHFMIYLGNNEVLHHRYNNYSNIEQLSPLHKESIFKILRYKYAPLRHT